MTECQKHHYTKTVNNICCSKYVSFQLQRINLNKPQHQIAVFNTVLLTLTLDVLLSGVLNSLLCNIYLKANCITGNSTLHRLVIGMRNNQQDISPSITPVWHQKNQQGIYTHICRYTKIPIERVISIKK